MPKDSIEEPKITNRQKLNNAYWNVYHVLRHVEGKCNPCDVSLNQAMELIKEVMEEL